MVSYADDLLIGVRGTMSASLWLLDTHPVSAPHTHTTSAEPPLKEANTLYTHTTSAEPPLKEANTLYSYVLFQRTSLLRKQSLLDVKYAV
jgi:hypothetical protein